MDLTQNKNIISTVKVLLLGVLSLVLFVIDWILISKAIYSDQSLMFWVWPGISIIASIAVLTLFMAVNSKKLYAISFTTLVLISYIVIFPKDPIVLLAGAIFFLLMVMFEQRIRSEEKSRHGFSIRRISDAGINVIIYAFLLLLGLNIYYNTSAEFKANPDSFYTVLGKSAAKSTKLLGGGGQSVDLNQTLDQYLKTETRKQVPNFDTLPEEFQRKYIEQSREQFFRQFNINIPSDQPLSEVVAQFAVERVKTSAERYSYLFPLIFTLIVTTLLSTFSFILRWLALFITWLFYKFLVRIRFVRLSKVMVEVDKLEI
ncbi:MAG: hypothetical protein KW804_01720 [Candidatus Doudnabacteria bacterium]|nr:hypothetical protein [Candidatus Doudnabacteria bacterium]